MKKELVEIAGEAIKESLPDAAVKRALADIGSCEGRTIIVSVGKAGWQMAKAAADCLKGGYDEGYVITKYEHSKGDIDRFTIYEAGHPVLDENSVKATSAVIRAVEHLSAKDRVLFLLSGGGSALFESPAIPLEEFTEINKALLACGADIVEMNTIRKRISQVKGGRFAQICAPAHVYSIILSDIVGDHPDMIASGPAYPDSSTSEDALNIVKKYGLKFSDTVMEMLKAEPVKELDNITTMVTGGVSQLCESAAQACRRHGYETIVLGDNLSCEARDAGSFLGTIGSYHAGCGRKLAFVAGGETVVHLKGHGKGGRNQEIALAAAEKIAGMKGVAVISVGSDGTDGPTDAAGGVVDGDTAPTLLSKGIKIFDVLEDNDAYNALAAADGLVITGATGTNVNDVAIVAVE